MAPIRQTEKSVEKPSKQQINERDSERRDARYPNRQTTQLQTACMSVDSSFPHRHVLYMFLKCAQKELYRR